MSSSSVAASQHLVPSQSLGTRDPRDQKRRVQRAIVQVQVLSCNAGLQSEIV
ncbi:hypothetical protein [Leptolyngbya sp. 'hensonii']|uniref:hypothetical protein n=1 Tax=Leptolyngbya sp. 'hensonii' TaxID=1922337 RepID=UPI0015C555CF|nr:hypothetical protein [Leptolyngbya sp. 'hensonii']